ncbi:hypothetical protein [Streptomyces violascens]|uniref:hypothetical protein n=1 Tax=Streptomyces violascens TaxID=67381 RepID=UPI00369C878E
MSAQQADGAQVRVEKPKKKSSLFLKLGTFLIVVILIVALLSRLPIRTVRRIFSRRRS